MNKFFAILLSAVGFLAVAKPKVESQRSPAAQDASFPNAPKGTVGITCSLNTDQDVDPIEYLNSGFVRDKQFDIRPTHYRGDEIVAYKVKWPFRAINAFTYSFRRNEKDYSRVCVLVEQL